MKKVIIRIGAVFVILTLLLGIVFGTFIAHAARNINYGLDEMLFEKAKNDTATTYYAHDESGELIEVWKSIPGVEKREWTHLDDIGSYLKYGFLAVEDREFYKHNGINLKRTLAAAFNYIFRFRDTFGASTVTQQLIKNISGDNQTTVKRKINEIFRALNLEKNHSKDDILELYLNIVPMSDNMYGVGIAAERYFGKECHELTVAEAATIVGITNAPSKYNPRLHPEACLEKRNRVLKAMLDCSVISEREYTEAKNSELILTDKSPTLDSLWFVETAKEDIISDVAEKYKITPSAAALMMSGSRIILTMNPTIQKILDDFFADKRNLSPNVDAGLNYSVVVTDPRTGDLLGVIGNANRKGERMLYNYATAPITPGSVIKPLSIYAPLLDLKGINWSYQVEDAPLRYIDGAPYPKNSPDIYDGMISVNDAIKKSKNTVAIRLYQMLGAESIYQRLSVDYGWKNLVEKQVNADGRIMSDLAEAPLALGQLTVGVPLRTLTESYNAFVNDGILISPRSYYCVLDKDGAYIVTTEQSKKRIMRSDTARIMNQLLSSVVEDGTASQIKLKEYVDAAGKTGTSGADRDRLFVGYTPYYTAGIWCGYSDGRSVGKNSPNHLEIWDSIMQRIHSETVFKNNYGEIKSFDTSGLSVQHYCKKSGMIPTENCKLDDDNAIVYGYFSADNMSKEECSYH